MTLIKKNVWFLIPVLMLSLFFLGSNNQVKVNQVAPQFVSAYPGTVEVQQPDGMPLTIMLVGDEYMHYTQTTDGYTLLQDDNGYYRYAKINVDGNMAISNVRASNPENRGRQESIYLRTLTPHIRYSEAQILDSQYRRIQNQDGNVEFAGITNAFPSTGTRNLLVILVYFTDKAFVKTNSDFNALYNTATVSFKNYYLATSYNQLTVNTTVVGPYALNGNMATYGANDSSGYDINPRLMVQEGVDDAEAAGLNFANFDNNGDGTLDGLQVVHSGYGEEAGAPADTIWSHQWTLSTYARTYDGVYINTYSTVPELYGTSGSVITGVGVLAHEFGHNIGCPDTYDTDYTSSGGNALACGYYDIMAGGSWNNNGNNPPLHNPYARWQLGWLTPTTVTTTSNLTLNPATSSSVVYRYDTTTTNEYFLLENRQQTGNWDYYMPGHGMLIFHIDGNYIATHSSNNINCDPSHQGIDIEEADGTSSTSNDEADPWPGTTSKTTFTDTTTPNAKSWAGANTSKPITAIAESSGVITFTITIGSVPPSDFNTALETTGMVYTTGGSANFGIDTTTYYNDGDSAASGTITHSQTTYLQTTVNYATAKDVKFYWKVSSESGYDFLKFYIDGTVQNSISGTVDWQQKVYTLAAGSHTLKWEYSKDSSVSSGSDKGWVDKLEFVDSTPPQNILGEAVDNTTVTFTTSGNGTWGMDTTTYYYGNDSAKSPVIGHSQSATFETTISGKTTVKFYWRVSSESGYDYLRFYIDGTLKNSISGSTSWAQKSYTVTTASHTIKWVYSKDSSVSSGSDCGWVDKLELL